MARRKTNYAFPPSFKLYVINAIDRGRGVSLPTEMMNAPAAELAD